MQQLFTYGNTIDINFSSRLQIYSIQVGMKQDNFSHTDRFSVKFKSFLLKIKTRVNKLCRYVYKTSKIAELSQYKIISTI